MKKDVSQDRTYLQTERLLNWLKSFLSECGSYATSEEAHVFGFSDSGQQSGETPDPWCACAIKPHGSVFQFTQRKRQYDDDALGDELNIQWDIQDVHAVVDDAQKQYAHQRSGN